MNTDQPRTIEEFKKAKVCAICRRAMTSLFEFHVECCDIHEWCKHGCLNCGVSRMEHYADTEELD